MRDITVVFTNENRRDRPGLKEAYVWPEVEFAARGERINWQFYATDSPIKHAVVLFEGTNPKYFKYKDASKEKESHRFPKELKETGQEKGKVVMYGEVPTSLGPAANKYWILGFKNRPDPGWDDQRMKREALAVMDPKIIVVP